MAKIDKKLITKTVCIHSYSLLGCDESEIFDGTIAEILLRIAKIEDYVESEGLLPHTIVMEYNHYDSYDDSGYELKVKASRYETDEERDKRMAAAEKRKKTLAENAKLKKQKKVQKELEEYERLKKKFGDR